MENKKVYLAKSNEASSSDVEYVRTSLLRIPNLELVEYSSGLKSSECNCIVIVAQPNFKVQKGTSIKVTKNVGTVIVDYLESYGFDENTPIYIYKGKGKSSTRDVEDDTPLSFILADFDLDYGDKEDYSTLVVDSSEKVSLLEIVSFSLGNYETTTWEKYSRHYQPSKKYALPDMPDFNSRRCSRVKTRVLEEVQESVGNYEEKVYVQVSKPKDLITRKRLL